MNTQQKWQSLTPEERRQSVDAYLINTSLNLVNPTSKDGFYLLKTYSLNGLNYVVFKVTRNESRDMTFFFSKLIDL